MKNKTNVVEILSKIFLGISIGLLILAQVFFFIINIFHFGFALLFASIWAGIGVSFGLIALVLFLIYKNGADKERSLKEAGNYVMADIVDINIDFHKEILLGSQRMHPYFILCQYVDGNGQPHLFKSGSLLYNPSGLLRSPQLKVWVDMANPKRYFVDTESILPGDAVLHKWDIRLNGKPELMESGNCLQATTCGIEHQGRILLSGICRPQFIQLPEALAEKLNAGLDEKNRSYMGYTILCRFDAPDGTPHIFASKLLFGEAASDYIDMPVKVYIDGNNYKKYHIDLRELGIYE